MARLPRLTLAGQLHHVVQRGNNRQAIFLSDDDRRMFMQWLYEYSRQYEVAVHAYVLMDNHFHALLTPHGADGLVKMMQALGRRYVRYFNDQHQRTGTLWSGRYKATILQPDRFLLTGMVSMDLNPVRAGYVVQPGDYPWSSHGHYVGRRTDRVLTPHPLVWDLGNTPFAREAAYAERVRAGVSEADRRTLNEGTEGGWVLGDDAFIAGLQQKVERRLSKGSAGRPRREAVLT